LGKINEQLTRGGTVVLEQLVYSQVLVFAITIKQLFASHVTGELTGIYFQSVS